MVYESILLSLAYRAGLRVSEVITLKVQDIDLEENTIYIKQAKGQKDLISVLPEKLVDDLRNMIAGKVKADIFSGSLAVFQSEKVAFWPEANIQIVYYQTVISMSNSLPNSILP